MDILYDIATIVFAASILIVLYDLVHKGPIYRKIRLAYFKKYGVQVIGQLYDSEHRPDREKLWHKFSGDTLFEVQYLYKYGREEYVTRNNYFTDIFPEVVIFINHKKPEKYVIDFKKHEN